MLIEFASAVDAVRSAIEIQRSMAEQNAAVPPAQSIEFRIGIHVGDIIFDDSDIFGDGVNIAARLEGIAEPGGALALNPNDPRLVVQRGINLTFLGEPEAALPWIDRAMRLDPFSAHRYYLDKVRALFMAGRPTEAIDILERTERSHWEHHLWLAGCLAMTERTTEALQATQQAIALRPTLSVATYVDELFKWKRDDDKARLKDALMGAGLPP